MVASVRVGWAIGPGVALDSEETLAVLAVVASLLLGAESSVGDLEGLAGAGGVLVEADIGVGVVVVVIRAGAEVKNTAGVCLLVVVKADVGAVAVGQAADVEVKTESGDRRETRSIVQYRNHHYWNRLQEHYSQSEQTEGKEGLVGAAHVLSAFHLPLANGALVPDRAPGPVAQHREAESPANQHDTVEQEVDLRAETSEAVEDNGDGQGEDGDEGSQHELFIAISLVSSHFAKQRTLTIVKVHGMPKFSSRSQ